MKEITEFLKSKTTGANWVNLAISIAIAAVVVLILRSMRRNRRQGKSSCGCSCAGCALHGQCGGAGQVVAAESGAELPIDGGELR